MGDEEDEEEGGGVLSLSDPSCKTSIVLVFRSRSRFSEKHNQYFNTKKVSGISDFFSSSSRLMNLMNFLNFVDVFTTSIGSADTLEFWW